MLEYPFLRLLLILFLVVLNGFFTAAEFAYVRVRQTRLQELVATGSKNAQRVIDLTKDLNKITSSAQLGITIASIILGFVGEEYFTELFTEILHFFELGGLIPEYWIRGIAFVTGLLVVTFMHVVFGELIPKVLSIQITETVALWCALPLQLFMKITDWLLYLFIRSSNLFLGLWGIDAEGEAHGDVFTEDELKIIIKNSIIKGELEEYESKLIFNILEFNDQNVKEIFTPRIDINALSVEASLEDIIDLAIETGYSRIPIFKDEFDKMIGFIHIKDVMQFFGSNGKGKKFKIEELLHDLIIAHEWKALDELFKQMQKSKIQLAIIVDEYGLVEGLVSVEDIIESIFGPIIDEFDLENNHQEIQIRDKSIIAGGLVSIGIFNETLEEKFATSIQSEDSVTLAGYVLELFESEIPQVGQEISDDRLKYKITQMTGNRIDLVEIRNLD